MTLDERRRQRRAEVVLDALGRLGSYKAAAHELGISEVTARRRVLAYMDEHGYVSWGQAVYYLRSEQLSA